MQKYRIATFVLGGLFLAPAAMAQSTHLAYATGEPRSEYMVFLDRGNQVPDVAQTTVRTAVSAAQAGKTVHVVGRGDLAEVVKQQMIRDGAPASSIVVAREPSKPLPKVDPIGDPATRKVEIRF